MRALDYQARVLEVLDAYLAELAAQKVKADKVAKLAEADPDLGLAIPDFPAKAWEAMKAAGRLPASRAGIPFSPRHDGIGRAVPNVTLKVPTGGGKTWLAVNAVSRIVGRYLGQSTGFVLWIVPNEAIHTQTLKHLKDRQHPYRQSLDRASGGRTKIMTKDDRLNAQDVAEQLCVMVLMLQAANRQTQDALRMFRDRGDVHGFFPAEGEQAAHAAELKAVPNLDGYQGLFPMVKDSLGNALRKIRPVVVMDEGQKATSDLAHDTLFGFNPSFVLELTATPKDVRAKGERAARYANLLVEVTGRELHDEDMIKMPLNLDARQGDDWRTTLNAARGRLEELDAAAKVLQGETGRYIRPIMLVQVERTGKEQRDGLHIHAEDVRDWLLKAGFDAAEVAIKTAEQNDLSQPENQDLLSPLNRVRVIITKAALQEGWDCPFAYVLCALAAANNLSAMTQLVGRILRQPQALKTDVPLLDECHVVTHHAGTADVVAAIKAGLEQDGLADLVLKVANAGPGDPGAERRKLARRAEFRKVDIYLPKVLRLDDGGAVRDLDYETDLLAAIDWRGFDPAPVLARIPDEPFEAENQLQQIDLGDGVEKIMNRKVARGQEAFAFDPAHAVRLIADLVPNPFVARDVVEGVLSGLRARGFDADKLGRHASFIVDELRKELERARADRAETLFKAEVEAGRIRFRLRLDGHDWRMPEVMETAQPEAAPPLLGQDHTGVKASLFAPMYRDDLNGDERNVAVMLDGHKAIRWWHRNVAAAPAGYGVQGWKRGRIYPDFLFALSGAGNARRIVALETKGDHLQNPDTDYKRAVLAYLSDKFDWEEAVPMGQLELENTGAKLDLALILMADIKARLPDYLET